MLAAALCEALKENNTLKVLCLSDNYLGEKGAQALAEALKVSPSVDELHLKGNELGDAGVQAICAALQVCVCVCVCACDCINHKHICLAPILTTHKLNHTHKHALRRSGRVRFVCWI